MAPGMMKMETIDKETAWEGNFLRAVKLTYKDRQGCLRKWEAVERVNCNGIVAIIPVTADGDMILIRQFRPVVNNYVIEFPAGLSDRGENLIDAARRELVEEIGYTTGEFVLLAEGPISSGLSTEMLTVFLANRIFPAAPELMKQFPSDESEDIEVIKTPTGDIYKALEAFRNNGDYVDIKIYGLLELAKKYLS